MWILGLIERTYDGTIGATVLYQVPDRKSSTLLPLIAKHVRPLTLVHTDGGKFY